MLCSSCGSFGSFFTWEWPFLGWMALSGLWGACRLYPKSRARLMCTSPSGVYLAGKLQWHFACGFNFGHSLRLTFVTTFVVLKRLGIALSELGGACGLCPGSGAQRVCASPSGIYPADGLQWCFACFGFGYGLDCHLWLLLWPWGAWVALSGLGGEGGLWAMSKIEISVRTSLAFRGLSCW